MTLQDLLFTLDTDDLKGFYVCTNNETFPKEFRYHIEHFAALFRALKKSNRDDLLQRKVEKLCIDRNRDIFENPHFTATSHGHKFECPIYPIDIFLEVEGGDEVY